MLEYRAMILGIEKRGIGQYGHDAPEIQMTFGNGTALPFLMHTLPEA